jgi:hypothetical protein
MSFCRDHLSKSFGSIGSHFKFLEQCPFRTYTWLNVPPRKEVRRGVIQPWKRLNQSSLLTAEYTPMLFSNPFSLDLFDSNIATDNLFTPLQGAKHSLLKVEKRERVLHKNQWSSENPHLIWTRTLLLS